jgi:phage minor structural protein
MIPTIHSASETNFDTLGLGSLSDSISCIVTEERNGIYNLDLVYPLGGINFSHLDVDNIIVAPSNDQDRFQPFRIYAVRPTISGRIAVQAHHISYQLLDIPCAPFSASSLHEALSGLRRYAVGDMPFTLESDFSSAASYVQPVPQSIRLRLSGEAGSIIDTFGGELEWDRNKVLIHKNRGRDNGVVISYGKNLTDYDQETNISGLLTGIYPYYYRDDVFVQLPERVITISSGFSYQRVRPMDLTDKFDAMPSEAQLRAAAQDYISVNKLTVPRVSIKASFFPLWQTEEYKDIAPLECVRLCDTVTVRFPKFGVDAKAKVIKTVYNVLEDRYSNIELGDARQTLDTTIATLLTGGRK